MNAQQRLYKSRSDAVYDITPSPKVTKEEDLQLLKFRLQIYELSGERELNFFLIHFIPVCYKRLIILTQRITHHFDKVQISF
jgi:hypothetical protein